MISRKLFENLEPYLKNAAEIWIAVALINDAALKKIKDLLPSNTIQHYLIGIDLPTPPSVLRLLKSQISEYNKVAIFKRAITYHPKVYIIRNNDGYFAFIGSANATQGGFYKNIELNFGISDRALCLELVVWFESLFIQGRTLTEEFILKYEITYRRNLLPRSVQRSNIDGFLTELDGNHPPNFPQLLVMDGQFFKQSDFNAFGPVYQINDTQEAKNLRKEVRLRLIQLHELIFPRFQEFEILDLHKPKSDRNLTSQYYHSRGSLNPKDAIWLNYGKSENELASLEDPAFTNHMRIQVILRHTETEKYIGIWLFLGKAGKSIQDRTRLKLLIESHEYLLLLFNLLLDLGSAYWMDNGNDELYIRDMISPQILRDFILEDDGSYDYIIGRNYDPNSDSLSIENIAETVLIEFFKLYQVYHLIKTSSSDDL